MLRTMAGSLTGDTVIAVAFGLVTVLLSVVKRVMF